jgi:photosystem II stability/assembly factor-like uncharacterized protein
MMIVLRWLVISLVTGLLLRGETGPVEPPRMLLLGAAEAGASLIAVGERGTILHSTNDGQSWTNRPSPTQATLTAVKFSRDGEHGWAVGHDAVVLATDDGGATWRIVFQGDNLEDSFLDLCVVDAETIIAVGAYGKCIRSLDGGQTWASHLVQDDDSHLNQITAGANGTLYIAGERGTLLRSHDRGDTWASIPTPYDGSFYGILPLDHDGLLAYGLRGHIYRSTDDGDSWSPVSIATKPLLATACRWDEVHIVLAGQSRAFLLSTDDGANFEPWTQNLTTGVACLLATSSGRLLAFGEGGVSLLNQP